MYYILRSKRYTCILDMKRPKIVTRKAIDGKIKLVVYYHLHFKCSLMHVTCHHLATYPLTLHFRTISACRRLQKLLRSANKCNTQVDNKRSQRDTCLHSHKASCRSTWSMYITEINKTRTLCTSIQWLTPNIPRTTNGTNSKRCHWWL